MTQVPIALLTFAGALAVTLCVTPLVIRACWKLLALDRPDSRKTHSTPVPRLGGVAVMSGFVAGIVVALWAAGYEGSLFGGFRYHWIAWIGAMVLLFLCGIWDDVKGLRPSAKLLVQTVGATGVWIAGFQITFVGLPGDAHLSLSPLLSFPITLFWIIGVTNAFNLIDGLDGLAAGTGLLITATVAAISFTTGVFPVTVISLALAGSLLGFLAYNFNPARIFLGDSGSQFVGFTLAVVSIRGMSKSATFVAILAPILALGLPILDTLLVIARRTWLIQHPGGGNHDSRARGWRGLASRSRVLFLADREHIHHNLLELGLSHRAAVVILYLVSTVFCVAAFALVALKNPSLALLVAGCVGLAIAGVKLLAVTRRRYAAPRVMVTLTEGAEVAPSEESTADPGAREALPARAPSAAGGSRG